MEKIPQALGFEGLDPFLRVSKTNDWVLSKTDSLVGPQEPLLATVKKLGISHAATASSEPSFMAPWRVGDAVVGRGNTG